MHTRIFSISWEQFKFGQNAWIDILSHGNALSLHNS